MNAHGWIQLALYVAALLLITKPLGLYLTRVLDADGKTFLDPVFKPVERLTYKVMRVDAEKEHDWKQYTIAMLLFSLVADAFHLRDSPAAGCAVAQPAETGSAFPSIFRSIPPPALPRIRIGRATVANGRCRTFRRWSAWPVHNFLSAAVGISIAAALVRGIARHTSRTIGNFWVDLTRVTYYLLLPICLIYAVVLVSQGMIQNFKPYDTVKLTEPFTTQVAKVDDKGNPVLDPAGKPVMEDKKIDTQTIVQGPMASQVAIKMLGTNGGGYVNANAAHPFENPTPFSNFLQILSIFAIPSALTYYLGRSVKNQRHGWAVWSAMFVVFLTGVLICWHYEAAGNPMMHQLGVDPASGNMEGKEVRFGIFNSALFATITTDASCGAVNSMHDSFTPLGGLVPLLNIELGEIIFGGVGAGSLRHARLCRAGRLHRRSNGRTHTRVSRKKNRALRRENGVVCYSRARVFHSWIFRLGDP